MVERVIEVAEGETRKQGEQNNYRVLCDGNLGVYIGLDRGYPSNSSYKIGIVTTLVSELT